MSVDHEDEPARWYADDVVRGFLGLIVVPASLLGIAAVWIATADAARADGLSRWLQAVIIAVLAFYFGNGMRHGLGAGRGSRRMHAQTRRRPSRPKEMKSGVSKSAFGSPRPSSSTSARTFKEHRLKGGLMMSELEQLKQELDSIQAELAQMRRSINAALVRAHRVR